MRTNINGVWKTDSDITSSLSGITSSFGSSIASLTNRVKALEDITTSGSVVAVSTESEYAASTPSGSVYSYKQHLPTTLAGKTVYLFYSTATQFAFESKVVPSNGILQTSSGISSNGPGWVKTYVFAIVL